MLFPTFFSLLVLAVAVEVDVVPVTTGSPRLRLEVPPTPAGPPRAASGSLALGGSAFIISRK